MRRFSTGAATLALLTAAVLAAPAADPAGAESERLADWEWFVEVSWDQARAPGRFPPDA
jgi:hypothetical protein